MKKNLGGWVPPHGGERFMHPGGHVVASGGSDGKVKLWDMDTNKCVQTVSEHTDQVWSVSWSADGKRLASGGDDRTVLLMAAM